MRYQISGKHIEIGENLPEHIKAEISEVIAKYAERPTECIITFSKDRHVFHCDATIHLSTGLAVNAHGKADEIYASFESAKTRMEKQLRRYKRRLKDHHNKRTTPVEVMGASQYILASSSDESDEVEPEDLQPIIIAEMETGIKSLSVGEAVMQMEIADEAVLLFRNEKHGRVNVVYRRADGNVGWIDPQ